MDRYTEETQKWLNERFRQTDADGVYFAHQPIYGFRKGHCEDEVMRRYIITHQIMNALGKLDFKSFLDIGGAEGYKAALVRHFFKVPVRSCDLSDEASRRSEQIFKVCGEAVDIANLPYDDNSFDVVLCSETLEHVVGIEVATREILRVARRAVVITVPKEAPEEVERNIREEVPHAHIHALDLDSFDWLQSEGIKVIGRRISSRGLLSLPMKMVAAEVIEHQKHSRFATFIYNHFLRKLWMAVFGKRAAGYLLEKDDARSQARANSRGLLFILVKDPSVMRANPVRISAESVLDFEVPLHYPTRGN